MNIVSTNMTYCAADAVDVVVDLLGHVIVDDEGHIGDVKAT